MGNHVAMLSLRIAKCLGLTGLILGWLSGPIAAARPSSTQYPIYESQGPEEPRSRILIENGGVLHMGSAAYDAKSLLSSDIGYSLYFENVMGGVRIKSQPLLFPDGTTTKFEFEDYSCSVGYERSLALVSCTDKLNGRIHKSQLKNGELVAFEAGCFSTRQATCDYHLITGRGLRPSKVESTR